MDLQAEELQFLTISDILSESISIPKQSHKTFSLITLTLVFPLSFAILAHSLFTNPILARLHQSDGDDSADWMRRLLAVQFLYLTFLFAFSLLSTAAVVFTVASLYAGKPASFSSTIAAVPGVLKRLSVTFAWVSLLMAAYYAVFFGSLALVVAAVDAHSAGLFLFSLLIVFLLFLVVHVYMSALWHLASVVSVLEPVYGSAAIKKSCELLKGKTRVGFALVFAYLTVCGVINGFFGAVVVRGGDDYGLLVRVLVGGFLVGVLVVVNLIGLLAQSVFYYVCKSHHRQGIDKAALYEHLGGYLGEYVPLKSSGIQMENLDDA